ncbi:hypothetical protein [Pedobacter xixiisoli]|uniref:Lipoprotein n=1 Tax=Pedobacter xixiisoli TaxID=1476464 RepID=A0A285ZU04_9SPHI|nr:hypothetical protein [Pedobacter xixiisoli]SOD13124.1 hypothetical protein SAMN06297358_1021 [Pedobacter xixiisoli]
MWKLICFILIVIGFFIGCRNAEKSKESSNVDLKDSIAELKPEPAKPTSSLDSIKQVIIKKAKKDTVSYTFLLEGNFSAEGNEGRAFYKDHRIKKIEISFYGEMGKAIYTYIFKRNLIEASQQRFNYKTHFTEVKSGQDIIKSEEINFTTDLDGKVLNGNTTEADLDTFYELKKVVPFDLI